MASIFDRIRQKAQQAIQSWQDRPSNQIFNTAKNAVTDYFKPSPNGVRTRDIVRELPGATAEVGRDYFVRPVAQSIASLGLTAREKMGGSGTTTPEEIAQGLPNKPVRDFLFGDQLPSSLQEQTR